MRATGIGQRRSGRIDQEITIQVCGTDVKCRDFIVPARTLILSRYGAKILLMPELIPEQEVTIHCPESGKDQDARVVALFTKELEGFTYGVEFLDQEANFWSMQFPLAPGASDWTTRVDLIPTRKPLTASSPRVVVPELVAPRADPPVRLEASRAATRKEPPAAAAVKNYVVRLQCPLGDQDQWVVLERREESLQKVLETRWDFECPIHGVQQEFPLDVKETPVAISPWAQSQESTQRIEVPRPDLGPLSPHPSRAESRTPEMHRVWVRGSDRNGNPFRQSARSIDVSRNGGRLDGVGLLIRPGVTIEVKRGWRKALFRVVWTGRFGTPYANEVGIYCLEPDKNIWGFS